MQTQCKACLFHQTKRAVAICKPTILPVFDGFGGVNGYGHWLFLYF
ncbi:hypothetical protein [Moraxella lacunata]